MKRTRPVIAIDGPAGAGKSTASRMLAQRLGFVLVDTGALYRGVALAALEADVSWDDGATLGQLAGRLALRMEAGPEGTPILFVEDRDRSDHIRTPDISRGASAVSKHAEVRGALLGIQRHLGAEGGVVLEGRDIGTVVFPDAEVKVFLTASPEVRAARRVDELTARGVDADFDDTLAEIRARDAQDTGRELAPLKAADDAEALDTTGLSLAEVVDALVDIVARRTGANPRQRPKPPS